VGKLVKSGAEKFYKNPKKRPQNSRFCTPNAVVLIVVFIRLQRKKPKSCLYGSMSRTRLARKLA
jgi:hypothetical protein